MNAQIHVLGNWLLTCAIRNFKGKTSFVIMRNFVVNAASTCVTNNFSEVCKQGILLIT